MVNLRGLGRLGGLAIGLGIGAAVAHSPVALADTSSDWLSSVDGLLSGAAVEAPSSSALNLAISFDGTSLISDGSATAYSGTVGDYDLAIAYGANSFAAAGGGFFNYALADGSGASAEAGADGGSGNNFDSATDIGNNTGVNDGSAAINGSFNTANQIGDNSGDGAGAYADAGNGNTAIDIGNNSGEYDGVGAGYGPADDTTGNYNTAIEIGNNSGYFSDTFAGDGSNNIATNYGNLDQGNYNYAGDGNGNVADTVGNDSTAYAGGWNENFLGNNDVAYVLDPFGTEGSFAEAGAGPDAVGNSDLAAVLFTDAANLPVIGVSNTIETVPSLF